MSVTATPEELSKVLISVSDQMKLNLQTYAFDEVYGAELRDKPLFKVLKQRIERRTPGGIRYTREAMSQIISFRVVRGDSSDQGFADCISLARLNMTCVLAEINRNCPIYGFLLPMGSIELEGGDIMMLSYPLVATEQGRSCMALAELFLTGYGYAPVVNNYAEPPTQIDVELSLYEAANLCQALRLIGVAGSRIQELAPLNTGDWVCQVYNQLDAALDGTDARSNVSDFDIRSRYEKK